MKMMPWTLLSFFFLLLLLLILAGISASAASDAAAPSDCVGTPARNASTEYIRKRCAGTLYPRLCFRSLAGYAGEVQQSDVKLARVASELTHSRLRLLSGRASALSRNSTAAERPTMRDCAEALADAVDLAGQAAAELRGLESAVGPAVAVRASNALTWMSAALTDEDTCSDGESVVAARGGTAVSDVYGWVTKVEKYTSNALAFIASLLN